MFKVSRYTSIQQKNKTVLHLRYLSAFSIQVNSREEAKRKLDNDGAGS